MAKPDESAVMIAEIGPLSDSEGGRHWLFAPLTPEIARDLVMIAEDLDSGVSKIMEAAPDESFVLSPRLASVASRLGVPTRAETQMEKVLRAELALGIAEIEDFPRSSEPERRRDLLRALSDFINSGKLFPKDGWDDIDAEFRWRENGRDRYLAGTLSAPEDDPLAVVVLLQDLSDTADVAVHVVRVTFEEEPEYALDPVREAYGFDGVPSIASDQGEVDTEWMDKWARIVAALCRAGVEYDTDEAVSLEVELESGVTMAMDVSRFD